MSQNQQTLRLERKSTYELTEGPTRQMLEEFYGIQEQHRSDGMLDGLEPVSMGFTFSSSEIRWTAFEVLVTALEDFDRRLGKVRIIGLYGLTPITIKYDIADRTGTFKYK